MYVCHPLTLLLFFFWRWRLFQRALEDAAGLLPGSEQSEVVPSCTTGGI